MQFLVTCTVWSSLGLGFWGAGGVVGVFFGNCHCSFIVQRQCYTDEN